MENARETFFFKYINQYCRYIRYCNVKVFIKVTRSPLYINVNGIITINIKKQLSCIVTRVLSLS